ncbi:hypothetical protein CLAVI_000424 [Candidatus Clavichlamydia salmonicola]|uniref:hypothetical protein n=1 Tax=Candidatus Clavichlamydia salmonicola TaxID=469812 RepID=UPI001891D601|nr:hypothetical protein [Candidatus Clavichlamydia salmonicola]MBF5050805.1 hypothetical protein [Candidatus Clavichlamydia salmonicola]
MITISTIPTSKSLSMRNETLNLARNRATSSSGNKSLVSLYHGKQNVFIELQKRLLALI